MIRDESLQCLRSFRAKESRICNQLKLKQMRLFATRVLVLVLLQKINERLYSHFVYIFYYFVHSSCCTPVLPATRCLVLKINETAIIMNGMCYSHLDYFVHSFCCILVQLAVCINQIIFSKKRIFSLFWWE